MNSTRLMRTIEEAHSTVAIVLVGVTIGTIVCKVRWELLKLSKLIRWYFQTTIATIVAVTFWPARTLVPKSSESTRV